MILGRPILVFLFDKEGIEEIEKPRTGTPRSFGCGEIVRKGNRPLNFTTLLHVPLVLLQFLSSNAERQGNHLQPQDLRL